MSTRFRIATRRAAQELAMHRRRLLEITTDPESDPADAMLLRISPPYAPRGAAATDEVSEIHQAFASPLSVGEGHSSLNPQERY